MHEPIRLLDDPEASAPLRDVLRHARPSRRMTAEEFQRGARRLAAGTSAAAGILLWLKGPAAAALIGAAGGLLFASGASLLASEPAPEPTIALPVAVPAPPVASAVAALEIAEPELEIPALPAPVRRMPAAPAASEEPPAPPQEPADTLAEETALIEQARAASPGRALELLDQHRSRFPSGKLAMERELLRVDALRRAGRVEEARHRVRALLARGEQGIYGARLRQLAKELGVSE
jgi:hypothetical protein